LIRGSCLCGVVRFEFEAAEGPFELCHCNRCRKVSGSAFFAGLGVRREDFRFTSGRETIVSYEAPILRSPPAFRSSFCGRCGSPVPDPDPARAFEVPAGCLDDDPGVQPDKHILVEHLPAWSPISDDLPQFDGPSLLAWRKARRPKPVGDA